MAEYQTPAYLVSRPALLAAAHAAAKARGGAGGPELSPAALMSSVAAGTHGHPACLSARCLQGFLTTGLKKFTCTWFLIGSCECLNGATTMRAELRSKPPRCLCF